MNSTINKANKPTTKDYLKLAGILLLIISFFVCLCVYFTQERTNEIEYIKADYTITKGIITKISLYKGKSVGIKYIVKNKIYEESDAIHLKLNKKEDDSIYIKYYNKNPELMISEYNRDF
ncbi:hypothetical protein [Flavobacterium hungaricum]|uniref:DUF3592 domain-containing protein n=1 Tax=Flavobacterium hungaricum TaxID=2082725 RepID=A0ABR9TDC0_9FLAO|nr:hypothetical protein [Flavobacterium hungaricum]MBE8723358.1 hypothetical protein [Flavobacterium hungaricum]